jgi:hypothetical protein
MRREELLIELARLDAEIEPTPALVRAARRSAPGALG